MSRSMEPNDIKCAFWRSSLHPASGRSPRASPSQLQRWDQRVREGRAVAAGFGAAERDVGGEAGAQRHLYYIAGARACEKGEQAPSAQPWARDGLPRPQGLRSAPNLTYNTGHSACQYGH